jgi:hypothetical protein
VLFYKDGFWWSTFIIWISGLHIVFFSVRDFSDEERPPEDADDYKLKEFDRRMLEKSKRMERGRLPPQQQQQQQQQDDRDRDRRGGRF